MQRMRTLWLRMTEVYGHKWTSAYGEDAAKGAGETWAKGLALVSPQQLAAGISAAIASADPWPPTLPEFRRMCLGIPTFAAVHIELRRNRGTKSPFLRQVWMYVDPYMLARADEQRAERMLRDAYELAVEYVMRGGPLPEGEAVIEPPKPQPRKPASSEVVEAELARMAEILRENEPTAEQVEGETDGECHALNDEGDV